MNLFDSITKLLQKNKCKNNNNFSTTIEQAENMIEIEINTSTVLVEEVEEVLTNFEYNNIDKKGEYHSPGEYHNVKSLLCQLMSGNLFTYYGVSKNTDEPSILLQKQDDKKIYSISFINDNIVILPIDIGDKTMLDNFESIFVVHNIYKSFSHFFESLVKTNMGMLYAYEHNSYTNINKDSVDSSYPEINFYRNEKIKNFRNSNKPIKEFLSLINSNSLLLLDILIQKKEAISDFETCLNYETFKTNSHYAVFERNFMILVKQAESYIKNSSEDFLGNGTINMNPYININNFYPEEYERKEDKDIIEADFVNLSLGRIKEICPATIKRIDSQWEGKSLKDIFILDEKKALYLYEIFGFCRTNGFFGIDMIKNLMENKRYDTILTCIDILLKRTNQNFFQKIKRETTIWIATISELLLKTSNIDNIPALNSDEKDFLSSIILKMKTYRNSDEIVKKFIFQQAELLENYRNGIIVKDYQLEDFNSELVIEDKNIEPLNNMPIISYTNSIFQQNFGSFLGDKKYFSIGAEGVLFQKDEDELVKIWHNCILDRNPFAGSPEYQNQIKYGESIEKTLNRKRKKIELLHDTAKELPGSIPLELITKDKQFVGYSMKLLKEIEQGDFENIRKSNISLEERISLIKKAEANIRMFHDRGICLGDLNETNFLGHTAKITDLDNASIGGLRCDLFPLYMRYYRNVIKKCKGIESDQFSFGITALSMLTGMPIHTMIKDEYKNLDTLSLIIKLIPDDYKDVKEYFKTLLSTTSKNDYITPMLDVLTIKQKAKTIHIDQKYFVK